MQSNLTPPMKVGNPKAYAEALSKPAPRRGMVVRMSVEVFHYYLFIHKLRAVGFNGSGMMVVESTLRASDGVTHE